MINTDISNGAEMIDVRDVIERYQELEDQQFSKLDENEKRERFELAELLANLRGEGGDEQWRGDWYPVTLVNDAYWEDYAQELANDVCEIPTFDTWPMVYASIDWEAAAEALQEDYTNVDYAGVTFWYR